MALKFNGTTDYLQTILDSGIGLPLSFCMFGNQTAFGNGDNSWLCVHNNQTGGSMNTSLLRLSGASDSSVIFEDSSTQPSGSVAGPSGYAVANTWIFCSATSRSDGTSRYAYVNGVAGNQNTTNTDPAGMTYIDIGRGRDFSGTYLSGQRCAWCAIWTAELTASEVARLYNNGVPLDPRNIRPDSLFGFWPLRNDLLDYSGNGHHMTVAAGAPTWYPDPPVMPYRRRVWRPEWSSAPAGGGVNATAAQTLPKLGQASTVGIRVGCTGAQTLPNLTQSATVGIRVAATADQTLPKLTQSASVDVATNEVNANTAQTLPKLQQSATVGIRVAATTSQTLPSLAQSANVGVRVGVTTAQTLPKITQSVSVDVQTAEVNANVTQTLPKLTQSVNVDVATTGVNCAALQTLPKLGQAVSVAIRVAATITQVLPKLTGETVEPARERLIVKSTATRIIAYPHGKICYWRE